MKLIYLVGLFIAIICAIKYEDYGKTPFGLAHKSCIHNLPDGVDVLENDDGTHLVSTGKIVKTIPKCPYKTIPIARRNSSNSASKNIPKGFAGGWQAWTTAKSAAATWDSFIGYFTIPNNPKNFNYQLLYMFTGLQNLNWIPGPDAPPAPSNFEIIQPVLQYGYSPIGGGECWGLASWYVTVGSGYLASNLIPMNPGDEIFGNMTQIGPLSWYINSVQVKSQVSTAISVTRNRLQYNPWAYCTLEVYEDDGSCSEYPDNNLVFSKMKLTQSQKVVYPMWTAHASVSPICKEQAIIKSPLSVEIQF